MTTGTHLAEHRLAVAPTADGRLCISVGTEATYLDRAAAQRFAEAFGEVAEHLFGDAEADDDAPALDAVDDVPEPEDTGKLPDAS